MYLLLRNNKQSGPYSLEELKTMGLKAYDLVWLEGKSAAWRYPSELEELKPFAPVVEEQPFDRFYRKSAPATTAANTAGATLSTKAAAADAPIPVTVETSRAPGKRIIYVTMPAARNATTTTSQPILSRTEPARESVQPAFVARETAQPVREATQAMREAAQPVREAAHATYESAQPVREPQSSFREDRTPTIESAQPVQTGPRVIEDYSAQQAGDQALLEEFFPRKKRSPQVVRLLTIAICILALLAAGIIIGLNLNKNTLGFPTHVIARTPPTTPDQAIVHPTAQQLPAPATTVPAVTRDSARAAGTEPTVPDQPNPAPSTVARATEKTPGFKQKERPSHPRANSLLPAKDSAGVSTVANAVHRADIAEPYHNNTELADKEAIKAALASQVSVGANGYSVGTFGGITGLQVTVTNRSVYPLDLVIVEVQYIQANKKIFKTEDLYFRGIGAGAALMQEAPKSSRGVRVQYKIMSITSKEVAYSYTGI